MTFRSVIGKCDSLLPNSFSTDEKMEFCEELSALIHIGYIKKEKNAVLGSDSSLPDGITPDRVRTVYYNGEKQYGESVPALLGGAGDKSVSIDYLFVPEYTLDDSLPVSAPFDKLFLYWLCAKVCLHTDDIEGYQNYMALYNSMLLEFKKLYAGTESVGRTQFKNLW